MRLTCDFQSTALSSASYDPDGGALDITFSSGRTFTYEGVPAEVFYALRDSTSPGSYFHANIKNNYG